jgi:RimJ/RimL family protein N-acetyltransferase
MEFPQRLRTQHLLLSRIERSDLDDFTRMRSDPQVTQVLGVTDSQQAAALIHQLTEHWQRHGYGWWIARDPDSGAFLGCGGLRSGTVEGMRVTEVAYGFLPEYWGRGDATELVRVGVAQGFIRLGVRDIVSFVLPENSASRRVMEKAGFTCELEMIHAGRPHVLYRLEVNAWRVAPLMRAAFPPRPAAVLQMV